jgi:hypothetical protein
MSGVSGSTRMMTGLVSCKRQNELFCLNMENGEEEVMEMENKRLTHS